MSDDWTPPGDDADAGDLPPPPEIPDEAPMPSAAPVPDEPATFDPPSDPSRADPPTTPALFDPTAAPASFDLSASPPPPPTGFDPPGPPTTPPPPLPSAMPPGRSGSDAFAPPSGPPSTPPPPAWNQPAVPGAPSYGPSPLGYGAPAGAITGEVKPLGGLTTALTVLVAGVGLLSLISALTGFAYAASIDGFIAGDTSLDDVVSLEDAQNGIAGLALLAILVAGVVWLVWQQRVRSNLEASGAMNFPFSKGMSVAAWFIPFANFVLPYQVTVANWRASEPGEPVTDAKRGPGSGLVLGWWLVWIISGIGVRVVIGMGNSTDNTLEDLAGLARFGSLLDLVQVGAAVLAVLVVRRITARTDERLARIGADR